MRFRIKGGETQRLIFVRKPPVSPPPFIRTNSALIRNELMQLIAALSLAIFKGQGSGLTGECAPIRTKIMESVIESRVLSSSSGSVSVSLHPLVIMNISDHYTRSHMQGGGTAKGVRE